MFEININKETRDDSYRRMDRDTYYLSIAFLTARRSHDSQTQCGCCFVKDDNILSTGFNGFLRGADDHFLPNKRPAKYSFICHSEANAIYNAARNGIALKGSTAYITGVPCPECAKTMIQSGVLEWVFTDKNDHSTASKEKDFLEFLIQSHGVKVRIVSLDDSIISKIKSL